MSRKTDKLRKAIEQQIGHTNFRVWYEPVHGPCFEMQGYAGGWYVEGEDVPFTPLGYSIAEAVENVPLFFRGEP